MAIKEIVQFDNERYLERQLSCFLAGGVSTMKDWQSEVINELEILHGNDNTKTNLVVYNPRISLGNGSMQDKIDWDCDKLTDVDIYSFYFCNDTMQGGSLFELGRYLSKLEGKMHTSEIEHHLVVTIEPEYCYREKLIAYMTNILGEVNVDIVVEFEEPSIKDHAQRIYNCFKYIEAKYQWDRL